MYSPKLRRIQKTGTEFRFPQAAEDKTGTEFRFPRAAGGKTGTGFRFPRAAEDKPEPGSGSRELPEITGTGFRFPGADEDKPEPGSGSRELPETNRNRVPVPTSCRGQNRNRVPVLLLCRNRVYISSFFLSPRRSALVICFSHVFSVSQRRKSRSGSSSCTLSHASSAS